MLPHTVAQLHLPKGRYTGQINGRIQYKLWKVKAEDYINVKIQLHHSNKLVNWEPLDVITDTFLGRDVPHA